MAQNDFQFALGDSPENIFAELQRLASNSGSMDWLRPIIDISFDGYAGRYLNSRPAKFVLFNPCRVEENLLEGSKLLDACIARKHEALELETEAILTALEINFSHQLAIAEYGIDEPQWQYFNNQSGGKSNAHSPVSDRLDLKISAFALRSNLHRTRFSAMNYGERVEHMRFLYSDTLRLCLERFYSAWIGLNRFFALKMPIPPGPYSLDGKGTVEDLTLWLRNAVEQLEIGEKDEQVQDFYFLAAELGSEFFKWDLTSGTEDIKILLNSIGPKTFGILDDGYSIRLLGIGLSVAIDLPYGKYREAAVALHANPNSNAHLPFAFRYSNIQGMRELSSLTAHVEMPRQSWGHLNLNYLDAPEQRSWKVPTMRIDGIQPWLKGSIREAVSISTAFQARNADPSGQWVITLSRRALVAGKIQELRKLNYLPEDEGLQASLNISMEDLIIGFRIAIRKTVDIGGA